MKNRFVLGDALSTIKKMPSGTIDLILTDPPYDIRKYSTGNIVLPGRKALNNDIADWDQSIPISDYIKEFRRLLKRTGNIFIFTSYNLLGKWHEGLDPLFSTCNFMIWHKLNPPPRIYKNSFLHSCEMIICAWDKSHTWNFSTQDKMHNFIESKICMRPERLNHPTQKPIAVITRIIEIASKPGDVILDCFAGTGTVGVAAQVLNRFYYLVELNPEYYKMALQRLKQVQLNIKQHPTS